MSRSGLAAIALAGLLGAACRYQPTPVPLRGDPADITAIAGNWSGDFSSTQSGRSGSISFSITAGRDTAYGDVLMTPLRGQPLMAADALSPAHAMHSPAPEVLRITFVRVTGGMVEGSLEPYMAPDCHCAVTTVFQGVVKGNTINGQYVTTEKLGLRQEGQWSVQRQLVASR